MVIAISVAVAFLASTSAAHAYPADDFVIKVKSDNTGFGASASTKYVIPTNSSETYNYNVDCDNDGTDEATAQTGDYTCDFDTSSSGTGAGMYTVVISDNSGVGTGFPHFFLDNRGDGVKILAIEQWGSGEWSSMYRAFYGARNLTLNATDSPDLSNVTNTTSMFEGNLVLDSDVSGWDVSGVTDMDYMFYGADIFNNGGQPLDWDVSGVTTMQYMFYYNSLFNQDIGDWDTSSVTGQGMDGLFNAASVFDQDISDWDVSGTTSMYEMFYDATDFDNGGLPLDWADTSNVTDMSSMFRGASVFNQDVSGWDVSSVKNMEGMFGNALAFNSGGQPLDWDVSGVQDMASMFEGAAAFNQDISGWDVSEVTTMDSMLKDATNFSASNYSNALIAWSALPSVQSGVDFSRTSAQYYSAAAPARDFLVSSRGWSIDSNENTGLTYTLTYDPTSDATLTGPSTQIVPSGGSGLPVTVVPDSGLKFVAWSDGSTDNPRTDTSVSGNVSATAVLDTIKGYRMLSEDGTVYGFGDTPNLGDADINQGDRAVDLEDTADGAGYWIATASGTVQTFGSATHYGANPSLQAGEEIVALAPTPSGAGYWLFSDLGRVFPFGDAQDHGSMAGVVLNSPVLDAAATPSGLGYYMVASDGGVFSFGDALFHGSMGGLPLNAPVQSLVPDPDANGYWLVAADGGVFAFGAQFVGSIPGALAPGQGLNAPITAMTPWGNGYLMIAGDGGAFSFSNQPFLGSLASSPPTSPVISAASF
ncbi:MAG: DUF285 domain-containing protein, partial [bacterium]|nr:DUF285 domain-containing protein [bacterium]